MTDAEGPQILEPVHAADGEADGKQWSYRLVVFLRVMAVISLCKGLYHWAVICGIGAPFSSGFDSYSTPYQVATVFFAVIDLVAGVGLWLAAPWGAVMLGRWITGGHPGAGRRHHRELPGDHDQTGPDAPGP